MHSQPAAARRVPWRLAIAGMVLLVPWLVITMIETDQGWGDAIWGSNPWRRDALALTVVGAVAALGASLSAIGRSRILTWATLSLEAAAATAWVVLAFAAPG